MSFLDKLITLSHSQMDMFIRCPKLHHYVYVEKVKGSPSPEMEFGSYVHDRIECELLDVPVRVLSRPVDKVLAETLAKRAVEFARDREFSHGGKLLFAVEQMIDVGWFKGIIDLMGTDKEGKTHVIDWKTTRRTYTGHDIVSSDQLTAYAYLVLEKYKVLPDLVHFVTLSKVSGDLDDFAAHRSKKEVEEWERKARQIYAQVKKKVNWKVPDSCYKYNRQCAFYHRCWENIDECFSITDLPRIGGRK